MKTAILFILFFVAFGLLTYSSAITPGTSKNASYVIFGWFAFSGCLFALLARHIYRCEA